MEGLRARVKRKHHSKPDVIIGKNGLTPGVIEEIKRRLDKEEIVKVKMLRTSLEAEDMDRRRMAETIARATGARLMGVRGRTLILYKEKPRIPLKTPKRQRATPRRR
ncbi:MAG: YhbY family RNA-binding protein [Desulfurococcales archaeon]|nr:YhbY family RNA-binding protein [Desulfurococcales archaeon]